MNSLGGRIRAARQALGYTQPEAAKKAKVNVSLYKQYELNIKTPKDSQLQKIAEALEVDFSFLRPPKIETNNELLYALREINSRFGHVFIEENGATIKIKLDTLRVIPTQSIPSEGQPTSSLQDISNSKIVPSSEITSPLPESYYTDRELAILHRQTIQDFQLIVNSQTELARSCIANRHYKTADNHLATLNSTIKALTEQAISK